MSNIRVNNITDEMVELVFTQGCVELAASKTVLDT